jgi:hypothetical protein
LRRRACDRMHRRAGGRVFPRVCGAVRRRADASAAASARARSLRCARLRAPRAVRVLGSRAHRGRDCALGGRPRAGRLPPRRAQLDDAALRAGGADGRGEGRAQGGAAAARGRRGCRAAGEALPALRGHHRQLRRVHCHRPRDRCAQGHWLAGGRVCAYGSVCVCVCVCARSLPWPHSLSVAIPLSLRTCVRVRVCA